MKDSVTNLNFYVRIENIDDKDLYTDLDLIIQFFKKNNFHGNINVSFDEFHYDEEDE